MKTLPNGLTVFNATPHAIRFWREDWDAPIEVGADEIVSAAIAEAIQSEENGITFVTALFLPTDSGDAAINEMQVRAAMNDITNYVIVGSIIAAQAYPGVIVAMTPAPGYERVPPAEKRMNPDKFTVY